ncbi:DVU0298 family protein [Desulfofundulus sp.]|uniref:DVU0298 family protein n=1 Tax=Desulfofundulus sp. TaxID=2282750 RepID=UPI003C752414
MRGRPPLKEYIQIPVCPFCGTEIERPEEMVATAGSPAMPVGSCACGAVYACDVSGRNLGSAFIEALVFACNMDWELAWNLLPDRDYREEIVKNYDLQNHLIVPGGFFEGRKIAGALYFIRLSGDMAEVTRQSVSRLLDRQVNHPVINKNKKADLAERKRVTKKEVEAWVKEYRVESVLQAAHLDPKILWLLRRFLCADDPVVRMRAADFIGRAAKVIVADNPGKVHEFFKALINSLADTGASSWATLDAVGEIMSNSVDKFSGYLPALLSLLNEPHLRAEVLRALYRIAGVNPGLLKKFSSEFIALLGDPDPGVRGYAILILGIVKADQAGEEIKALRGDKSKILLYENGRLFEKSIGTLAEEALHRIGTVHGNFYLEQESSGDMPNNRS